MVIVVLYIIWSIFMKWLVSENFGHSAATDREEVFLKKRIQNLNNVSLVHSIFNRLVLTNYLFVSPVCFFMKSKCFTQFG